MNEVLNWMGHHEQWGHIISSSVRTMKAVHTICTYSVDSGAPYLLKLSGAPLDLGHHHLI